MLHITLFDHLEEVSDLSFIESLNRETIVVTPSSIAADSVRSHLQKTENVDVVTFSKFLNTQLSLLEEPVSLERKADLMMKLSTAWKSRFTDYPKETFLQAFNLFTELRGFTLNREVVAEVLPFFHEYVQEGVKFFWEVFTLMSLVDEHEAQSLVAKAYGNISHSIQNESEINVVFWGFTHMTAIQIDLIQNLKLKNDVYIPLSKAVFHKTTQLDWTRWLFPDVDDQFEVFSSKTELTAVRFAKNRLSQTIKQYHQSLGKAPEVVTLAEKNPSREQILEIALDSVFFKSSCQIYDETLDYLFDSLEELDWNNEKIAYATIRTYLKELLLSSVKSFKTLPIRLKVSELAYQTFEAWSELSDLNMEVSKLDLIIVKEVVKLGLPRNSVITCLEEFSTEVFGLEFVERASGRDGWLVGHSGHRQVKGTDSSYPEKVMKILATIGPIRQANTEFQFLKQSLLNLLKSGNCVLFLEKGLEDHDEGWNELLREFDLQELEVKVPKKIIKKDFWGEDIDLPKIQTERYSATRLQSYIDCPRKYLIQYGKQIDLRTDFDEAIRMDQLGIVEHDVIGEYLKQFGRYDSVKHSEICKQVLHRFLAKEEIKLSKVDYSKALLEIEHFSQNGIELLLLIQERDPSIKWTFEVPVSQEKQWSGSIDCFGVSDTHLYLFDFKRSGGSIPSHSELSKFGKVQLWFYLSHRVLHEQKPVALFGYLSLKDLSESLVYSIQSDPVTLEVLEPMIGDVREGETLLEELENYNDFECDLIETIENDAHFYPKPKEKKVCGFCSVRMSCPRAPMEGGDGQAISK